MNCCDDVSKEIAKYIKNRGLELDTIARDTGISRRILEMSIRRETRRLHVDEFLTICSYLKKDPHEFVV